MFLKVWGTCSFLYTNPLGVENEMNKKTSTFKSDNIKGCFNEFLASLMMQYGSIKLSSLKFHFNFIILPSGGCCGTTDRSLESVFMKKSVIKVVNDDNNCFWYSMAILMSPKNKQVKDHSWPKTRVRFGS